MDLLSKETLSRLSHKLKVKKEHKIGLFFTDGILYVEGVKERGGIKVVNFGKVSNLSELKLKGRFSVPLHGPEIVARTMTLPRIPASELKEAVLWASRRHIPFDPKEAVVEFVKIGEVEELGSPKEEIFIAATKKSFLDDLLKKLEPVKDYLDAISPIGFSIWNLFFLLPKEKRKGVVLFLDIEEEFTNISIFWDERLKFSRDVLTSFSVIKKDMERGPLAVTTPSIRRLLGEIDRSVSFVQGAAQLSVERIFLMGKGANVSELKEVFSSAFAVDVETLSGKNFGLDIGAEYLVPFGMCVDVPKINFLPKDIIERSKEKEFLKIGIFVTVLTSFFLSLFYFHYILQEKGIHKRILLEEKEENRIKSYIGDLSSLRERVNKLFLIKNTVKVLEEKNPRAPSLLKDLSHLVPRSVVLSQLKFSKDGRLILDGFVIAQPSLLETKFLKFLARLQKSGLFYDVEVVHKGKSVISKNRITLVFTLELKVKI